MSFFAYLQLLLCIQMWNLQVKYVVELARALTSMPSVYRVDLLTRQVASPEVYRNYGEPTEMLSPNNSDVSTDALPEEIGEVVVHTSSVFHLVQKTNTFLKSHYGPTSLNLLMVRLAT